MHSDPNSLVRKYSPSYLSLLFPPHGLVFHLYLFHPVQFEYANAYFHKTKFSEFGTCSETWDRSAAVFSVNLKRRRCRPRNIITWRPTWKLEGTNSFAVTFVFAVNQFDIKWNKNFTGQARLKYEMLVRWLACRPTFSTMISMGVNSTSQIRDMWIQRSVQAFRISLVFSHC